MAAHILTNQTGFICRPSAVLCKCLFSYFSRAVSSPSQTALSLPTLFSSCNVPLDDHLPRDPFPVPLPSSPNPCASQKSSLSSEFTEHLVCTYLHPFAHSSVQDICFQVLWFLWDYQLLYLGECLGFVHLWISLNTTSVPVYTVTTKSMLTEQNLRF